MRTTKLMLALSILLLMGCQSAVAPRSVTISGTVLFTDNSPVATAKVSIPGQVETFTDASGRYMLRFIPVADFVELQATDAYQPGIRVGTNLGSARVAVAPGQKVEQDIVLTVFMPF